MIKKKLVRTKAAMIAIMLAFMTMACGVSNADKASNKQIEKQVQKESETLEDTMANSSFGTSNAAGKEETVYVTTDANGGNNVVVVSEWLKNSEGSKELTDTTLLKDIKNVKGNGTYKDNGDGTITWQANGNDVYYQGTTDKKLPVSVKVTYFLDGKEVAPKDIAGKSGKVKIRFDYTNNDVKKVQIAGKETDIYTPYAMVSGVMLDSENFKNVDVTNGKVIAQGNKYLVMGVALPGLKESLNIDQEKLDKLKEGSDGVEIPDYVEITADAKDFSLDMTMTMASDNALSDLGLSGVGDSLNLDKVKDDVTKLQDGTGKLVDGSGKLYDGTVTLKDGTKKLADGSVELFDGTTALSNGALDLKDGTAELAKGAQKLVDGAGKLSDGTVTLKDGTSKLAEGAGTLKNGTSTLASGVGTLKDGSSKLASGAGTLKDGTSKLANGAGELQNGAVKLKDGVTAYTSGVGQVTEGAAALDAGLTKLQAALSSGDTDGITSAISELNGALTAMKTGLEGSGTAENPGMIPGLQTMSSMIGNTLKQNGAEGVTADNAAAFAQGAKQKAQASKEQANNLFAAYSTALMKYTQKITIDSMQQSRSVTNSLKSASKSTVEASLEDDKDAKDNENIENKDANTSSSKSEQSSTEESVNNDHADNSTTNNTAETHEENAQNGDNSNNESSNKEKNADAASNESAKVVRGDIHLMDGEDASTSVEAIVGEMISMDIAHNPQKISDLTVIKKYQAALTDSAKYETAASVVPNLVQLKAGVDKILDGAQKLDAGVIAIQTKLSSQSGKLGQLAALKQGVDQLKEGAAKLKDGTTKLNGNSSALVDGADKLANGAGTLKDGAGKLDSGVGTLKDGADKLDGGVGTLKDGADKLDSGAGNLKDGADKLDSGASDLMSGAKELHDGTKTLNDGAIKLDDGTGKLKDGADKVNTGTEKLKNGAKDLDDGADKLKNGAKDLSDGIIKLDDEGISKIAELFDGNLEELKERLDALKNAATTTSTLGGANKGSDVSTKYIIKTEGIKAD